MIYRTALFAATLVVLASPSPSAAEVRYRLSFDAVWGAETHPVDIPSNPHFSALIGGVHSDRVEFWAPGGLATPGIEFMAEGGTTFVHADEVEEAIAAGDARTVVRGSGISVSPGSGFANLTADADHRYLSLTSMIAPSPDWFVGVHSLPLAANDAWLSEITVPLFAYDAGTDDGVTYRAPDANSNPQQPIARVDNGIFDPNEPIGSFTIVLLPPELPGDADGNGEVDLDDFAVLRNRFGSKTLDASAGGDFDQNGVVDLRDFGVLKTNFGSAAAVPEPSGALLAAVALATRAAIRNRVRT